MKKWKDIISEDGYRSARLLMHRYYVERAEGRTIYPPADAVFSAMAHTPPEKVKVVIIGQDPYHEPGQANGLAFSVNEGVTLPPTLRNIFAELHADIGCSIPTSGDLRGWAKQGVLLLNTSLTVYPHQADSCRDWGWGAYTREICLAAAKLPQPIAFILWGQKAQDFAKGIVDRRDLIQNKLVIRSVHPSPLSAYRGFFGSKPFSRANDFLVKHGVAPVEWERTSDF